jgi:MYXO-CTERM domain-containing protein
MRLLPAAALLVLFLASAMAHAEEVVPHRNCPSGSKSVSAATSEWEVCEPVECSDDTTCASGTTCQEALLCVQTAFGGRRDAVGECSKAGSCTYPASCETGKRCVKASVLRRGFSSCGCRAEGARAEAAFGAVGAASALLAFAMRRRRGA